MAEIKPTLPHTTKPDQSTKPSLTFDQADSALYSAFVRLCPARHWHGFRTWLYAKAILKADARHLRAEIFAWIDDMVEDAPGGLVLELEQVAVQEWIAAIQETELQAHTSILLERCRLSDEPSRLIVRVHEVAGFLDGLLNRDGELPHLPALLEAIAQLEEIEGVLSALEGIATGRTEPLVLPALEDSINLAILAIASGLGQRC